MSGVDPNGGGAVVVPGAGPTGATGATGAAGATGATGPAGPAPSGTGLVSVTDGVLDTPSTLAARVTADAAALRAILDATRTTTPSLASTSGWTNSTSGSGATSTLNTGSGLIELAINDNGGTARIERTMVLPPDYRVQLRVRSATDTTTNVQLNISPYQVLTPFEGPRFTLYGDGSVRLRYVDAGGTNRDQGPGSAIAAIRAAMTAGTLWLRTQCLGGVVSWQYAIGATEASLAWLYLGAYVMPLITAQAGERVPSVFNVGLSRIASSGAQTATIDSVSYRDLSP